MNIPLMEELIHMNIKTKIDIHCNKMSFNLFNADIRSWKEVKKKHFILFNGDMLSEKNRQVDQNRRIRRQLVREK